jgi:formylglycine-generating enzyme required for sulfatase activity
MQSGAFYPEQSEGEARLSPDKILFPQMIAIPAGPFAMGTGPQQIDLLLELEDWAEEWVARGLFAIEQPYHTLDLPGFRIARCPVTNRQYAQFIWDSEHHPPRYWQGFRYPEGLEDHPVVDLSLEDCLAYVAWLNARSGGSYRLPNEAEWERAARGEDGRLYPWGDAFNPWRCNTLESAHGTTTPVGAFSPSGDSPYGLADVCGNVWEWTSSPLRSYPFDAARALSIPLSPETPYVMRGGAWYYSHKLARCASREGALAAFSSQALGFRLAADG